MQVLGHLPQKWADVCAGVDSATFAWSQDGSKARNGWVDLQEAGRLLTSWGEGTWRVLSEDVLEMNFAAVRHVCAVCEGGFVVEERHSLRTGRSLARSAKPRGWIAAGESRGESRGEARKRPREEKEPFSQRDLQLEAFFSGWEAWAARRMASGPRPEGPGAPARP
mmetsp:Transcript_69694/g.192910  ORF Transcript_69694/g.192910 Transcript_69694/m.192910 type:complete len:166 (-) Transcript_69694:38-535(-)